ncbi:serine proteinase stubble [Cephus cinctus]|uniref:Serine proteinase stubble n=2 Tax=Hymenoptera TaxID=7399 RepID=A0AAJ7C9F7_CEPCN|nr:serine proteinase stubble [Cephus cinctus]XP_015604640.1 serine proteinase stubble [Cephus cinctus]
MKVVERLLVTAGILCGLLEYRILANPIYSPQFLLGGIGRNIRHLPCVSRRTGETGVCMFAFTCVKANGTHLGTCIDRFYFGSCCKINDELDLYPQDNTIEEGPSRPHVTNLTSIESNNIPGYFPKPRPKPEKKPVLISSTDSVLSSSANQPGTTQNPQKVVTNRPNVPDPTTETVGLSTFQTVQNVSPDRPSVRPTSIPSAKPTTRPSVRPTTGTQQTLTTSGRPQRPVFTTNHTTGRPTRPRPPISQKPINDQHVTKIPSLVSTNNVKPTTYKPVQVTTSRPSASTTQKTTPGTRFPPRNSTTSRPNLATTKRPDQTTHKKPPVVTTRRPIPTRRTTTTIRPLTTGFIRPNYTTAPPISSTSKVVQGSETPATSTESNLSTVGPKPPAATEEDIPFGGYKPTKKPTLPVRNNTTTSSTKSTTTVRSIITTIKPQTIRPKPSAKPTKAPTTTRITPRPVTSTTERAKPVLSSSKPTASSTKPRPSEKPGKPTKPSIKPPVYTVGTTSTMSSPTSALLSSSSASVTFSPLNASTLTNEILPGKEPEANKVDTANDILQTTHSPGLVTWTSNSDETATKVPNISSSTSSSDEAAETEWTPITTPDGWIMIQSPSPGKPNEDDKLTIIPVTKPPKKPVTTIKPTTTTTESATTERITTRPTIPAMLSPIATVTMSTDLPVPMETLNMSDYKQVCGRRLFPESRIVGGERSSFGKWPWQISLRQWRTSTYLHKCGAALLNQNWAITAAHCVENVPPSDLLLRIGEHDLANEDEPYGYQERRVQIVASHPQFDARTFEYDLALLRFYEPLEPFQPNALPICLPDDDDNYVGLTAYVTGWGRLYEDGPLPSVMQEVSVPVINNTVCEAMYRNAGYIEHIPNIFICAGWRKGGFDSCEGDSGGPMVIQRPRDKRWILAGVISWGIGCAEPNQPGVYTRISEFREWINQILQF